MTLLWTCLRLSGLEGVHKLCRLLTLKNAAGASNKELHVTMETTVSHSHSPVHLGKINILCYCFVFFPHNSTLYWETPFLCAHVCPTFFPSLRGLTPQLETVIIEVSTV